MFSVDSAGVAIVLEPAKKANPDVPADAWQRVKVDAAAVMRTVYTEKGGAVDALMHKSLESLSLTELQRLKQLMHDPAFIKFHEAMASPAVQQQLRVGVAAAGAKIGPLINKVLADHHLNEMQPKPAN